MFIAIIKKVKFDGAGCPFSTFLRLQGDHHCACAQKWRHFSFFSKTFQAKKKIKALRPKMTKIASRGSCLKDKDKIVFVSITTGERHAIEESFKETQVVCLIPHPGDRPASRLFNILRIVKTPADSPSGDWTSSVLLKMCFLIYKKSFWQKKGT